MRTKLQVPEMKVFGTYLDLRWMKCEQFSILEDEKIRDLSMSPDVRSVKSRSQWAGHVA